jgi:hypothetical protein
MLMICIFANWFDEVIMINIPLISILVNTKSFVFIENEVWKAGKFRLLSAHTEMIVFAARIVIRKKSVSRTG